MYILELVEQWKAHPTIGALARHLKELNPSLPMNNPDDGINAYWYLLLHDVCKVACISVIQLLYL